jgi:hypothetical protein
MSNGTAPADLEQENTGKILVGSSMIAGTVAGTMTCVDSYDATYAPRPATC